MSKDFKKTAEKLIAIGTELQMLSEMVEDHKVIINNIQEYDIDAEVELFDEEIVVLSTDAKQRIKDIIISDINNTIHDWVSEMYSVNHQIYNINDDKDEDMPF